MTRLLQTISGVLYLLCPFARMNIWSLNSAQYIWAFIRLKYKLTENIYDVFPHQRDK